MCKCPGLESNQHTHFGHKHLKLARLPIPPPGRPSSQCTIAGPNLNTTPAAGPPRPPSIGCSRRTLIPKWAGRRTSTWVKPEAVEGETLKSKGLIESQSGPHHPLRRIIEQLGSNDGGIKPVHHGPIELGGNGFIIDYEFVTLTHAQAARG